MRIRHILYTHISDPKFYNPDTKKYESLKYEFSKKRKHGISGFMRIFNEEETIENVILSCIDGLDELVICLNNCYDNMENIVKKLIEEYPEKIKLYRYDYDVYACRSKGHRQSKFNDERNLANYYNYTLSKCSFKYAVKIDGDTLMIKEDFEEICKSIRENGLEKFLYFHGINLYKYNDKVYFFGKQLIAGGLDIGFFNITKYTYFLKSHMCERFAHTYHAQVIKGVLFFHLKRIKKDRGLLNRSLSKNKLMFTDEMMETYGFLLEEKSFEKLKLMTFSQLVEKRPEFKNLKMSKEYKIEE